MNLHGRLLCLASLVLAACQSLAPVGTQCTRDAQCSSGLVCALGACRSACRESRDCGADQRCLVEISTGVSVCSVDQVDDCTAHGCPDGLVCHESACVNACGTVVACPDGLCVGDVCMARPTLDGGPQDDAAIDGGTQRDAASGCHGPSCDPVVSIAMGAGAVLAVTASGALWGWGKSLDGVLGDGMADHGACTGCSPTPVRALAVNGSPFHATHVSIGTDFSCAVDDTSAVWCWGRNYDHQRGDGLPDDGSLTPHAVVRDSASGHVQLDHVTALTSGDGHTCALRDDQTVWCWGDATMGALGNGSTTAVDVAVQATELGTAITSVVASGSHTIALGGDGTLRGVGDDRCAALAEATPSAFTTTAVPGALADVASIATGRENTCALTRPGAIGCWGSSTAALGLPSGTVMPCALCGGDCTPLVHDITQPSQPITRLIGHCEGTFFALSAAGTLYVWGGAYDEPYSNVPVPVSVPVGSTVVDAQVSGPVACAVTTEGDVLCWGQNDRGQLGRGVVWAPMVADPVPARVVWP